MSRLLESLQRRRAAGEPGFTVIELVVAITLLAIVAAAAIPLLIVGAKAAYAAKLHTQAKNLSQQRIESMRDMQFHVDRQNGPFVDMLDVYYTNLSSTPTTRVRGSETMVDKWFSDTDTTGRTSLDPTGAFFQVTVGSLPGYTAFSQTIDTQFLTISGSAAPTASLSGYDSQVEGADAPPTLMVGVTVITSWSDHSTVHSYSNYTRITDSRGTATLVSTQGSGELMRLTSATPTGSAITVDVGQARADGNLTTGSTATAAANVINAVDGSGVTITGANGVATSPNTSGTTPTMSANNVGSGSSGCGLVTASATQISNLTSGIPSGVPKAPSNVDLTVASNGTMTATPSNQVAASLMANSSGSSQCGLFSFGNESTSYDPALQLGASYPLVRLPNASGNAAVASGSAWVSGTGDQSVPHGVYSGATASTSQRIQLFPGASFVTDGGGVVEVTLTQSSLNCSSIFNTVSGSSGVTAAASGSWSAQIDVWTTSGRRWLTSTGVLSSSPTTLTWSSGSSSTDPLAAAAFSPSSIQVATVSGAPVFLSRYISSWSTAQAVADGSAVTQTSGVHQLTGIVALATAPVRVGDPLSTVGVQIGNLSCAAEDNR